MIFLKLFYCFKKRAKQRKHATDFTLPVLRLPSLNMRLTYCYSLSLILTHALSSDYKKKLLPHRQLITPTPSWASSTDTACLVDASLFTKVACQLCYE